MLRKGSFWVGLLAALLILVVLAGAGYAVFRWGYAYGVAQSANWQPPSTNWQPPSAEDLQQWRQQWREDDDGRLLPFMLRRSYGMMPFGGMHRRPYGMMPFSGGFGIMPFGGFGGFSILGALFGVVGLVLLVLLIIGLVRFAFRPWGAPPHAHGYPPPAWVNQPPQSTQPQSPPDAPHNT